MMNSTVRKIISSSSITLRSSWSSTVVRSSSDDAAKKTKKNKVPEIKDRIFSVRVRGSDVMRDPGVNKGVAFTIKERQLMGLHGLLPPVVKTQDEQVYSVMENFLRWDNDLDRYIYLMGIQDRNEKLFFRVINDYVEQMLPIVYTPTVGLVCQKYGVVYRKPRGLFITIHDRGHVYEILCNWPQDKIKAIVVTDGERILGLGDLGAFGMGIPVGKLALYTALAGIHPKGCLPVMIDCGTNNKELLDDPLYIGLRHKRIQGPEYQDLMDEFMEAVVRRYGPNCLIQFEDFGGHNAFKHLDRYRSRYCTFNDDIQGTASVALSGILASLRVTKTNLVDNKFLFLGAGEAAFGIARFLASALKIKGLSEEDACGRIYLFDKDGLIVRNRPEMVDEMRRPYVKDMPHLRVFEEAVNLIKPTVIIGAAGQGPLFTPGVLRAMAQHNERPVIFALSNPTSKAECTAEDAYRYTNGKCVFASGSPFKAVTTEGGRTIYPGQGNNAYIFPGVALAVVMCNIPRITEEMFVVASETLAGMVKEEHLAEGRIYPPLSQILNVSLRIATRIAEHCYKNKEAHYFPEPPDKEEFLRKRLYSTAYESFEPNSYPWPEDIPQ